MRTPTRALGWSIASAAVACGLVLLWQLVSQSGWISPIYLPSPVKSWQALLRGFEQHDLGAMTAHTVGLMLAGWLAASVVGVCLGALIGMSPRARAYLQPSLELLRPLPASALAPVAIAIFGLSNAMTLSVTAFGALWPMLLATVHGFSSVEPRLYEVSKILGLRRWETAWKLALPHALPDILAGMRLSLTISLILAVLSEMLSSIPGLGLWVLQSARAFRSPELFAGVLLLGLIGLVSAALLAAVETRLLRWRTHLR